MTDIQITYELLCIIYARAKQYAITKYGNDPDRIELESDGSICARWIDYRCGEMSEDTEYIYPENLTEDLDAIAAQRTAQIAEDKRKRDIYEAQQKELREKQAKEDRKRKYLELKKEFE